MRDCHIRIDKEGNWFYNNSPVTNQNILLYFNRHIVQDKQGNYLLQTKNQTCVLEVEDTPYIIQHCHIINTIPPKFKVLLNDKTEETVDWSKVWLKGESQIYCLVKDGAFEARFNRNSQFELGDLLQFDPRCKNYYLAVKGKHYYMTARQANDRD